VQCDTVVPDRDEKDFVTSQDLLDVRADPLLATLTTAALEESFCRVQIFRRRADACQILPEGTATPAIDQTDRRYRELSPDHLMTAIHAACPQLML
jgi:hypothetical protein